MIISFFACLNSMIFFVWKSPQLLLPHPTRGAHPTARRGLLRGGPQQWPRGPCLADGVAGALQLFDGGGWHGRLWAFLGGWFWLKGKWPPKKQKGRDSWDFQTSKSSLNFHHFFRNFFEVGTMWIFDDDLTHLDGILEGFVDLRGIREWLNSKSIEIQSPKISKRQDLGCDLTPLDVHLGLNMWAVVAKKGLNIDSRFVNNLKSVSFLIRPDMDGPGQLLWAKDTAVPIDIAGSWLDRCVQPSWVGRDRFRTSLQWLRWPSYAISRCTIHFRIVLICFFLVP